MTKPTVFIHTNKTQLLGAKISEYSLQRNSRNTDKFDVQIIEVESYSQLTRHDGDTFIRDGQEVVWHYSEMQSFTTLRFLPPQLMNFEGRSLLIDPDIFAVDDVWELLSRDMQGKAILCREAKSGRSYATSAMLMDNAKLTHWKWDEQIEEMFAGKRDYQKWVSLELEPPESLGLFENSWNDFDHLDKETKMVHNTRRTTQPWRTGLPFKDLHKVRNEKKPKNSLKNKLRSLLGKSKDVHRPHPDKNQQNLFFGLLNECLEKNIVTNDLLQQEIAEGRLRVDAFEVLQNTPRLDNTLQAIGK